MDTRWKRSNSGSTEQLILFIIVLLTNPFIAFVLAEVADEFFMSALSGIFAFLACIAVCLLCIIRLFMRTGCVPGTDEIDLGEAGKLPTELLAFIFLATPLFVFALLLTIGIYDVWLAVVPAVTLGGGVMLACLLALARKWKAGRLVADSVLVRVWPGIKAFSRFVLRGLRGVLTGENYLDIHYPAGKAWTHRILWVCGAMVGLVVVSYLILSNQLLGVGNARWFGIGRYTAFAMFAIIVVAAGAAYLAWHAYRDAQSFDALLAQIDTAGKGEEAPVCVPEASGLHAASYAVAQIGTHLKESVDAQMKSERMKLDLITNVSHDLKTPLTSIIGYLDLLEKQELQPETRDYVLILRQKSERLATTVADLFTLAKATSGSETLQIEPLDLVMAARQTLGDLSDSIRTAGIPVKATMPESAIVRADSAKLYRVLQNILDNALRYSLAGTRIYLEVTPGDIATRLTLTNIASYEMTFAPEEVLQRFVRGDASRTTEGSGLGLSIAQTFMQNFGGDLAVDVRGDAFVVTLTFPNGEAEKKPMNGKSTVVYNGERSEEALPEWSEWEDDPFGNPEEETPAQREEEPIILQEETLPTAVCGEETEDTPEMAKTGTTVETEETADTAETEETADTAETEGSTGRKVEVEDENESGCVPANSGQGGERMENTENLAAEPSKDD